LASDPAKRSALHAKCVVVDSVEVFVSSANFTEAAQQRNLEIGLLLRSPAIASQVGRFFESLLAKRQFERVL
jgi:phosphatidylserine/phosphatidylglycerophosphate/cardiolipin synthase-like enzyme